MNCTRNVDIRAAQLRFFKNVSTTGQCAHLCRKDAKCAIFVRNRYRQCYLREAPWLRTPVVAERTDHHGTISCIIPARIQERDVLHLQRHQVRAALMLRRQPAEELRASKWQPGPPTFFCWMLVRIDRPSERDLLCLHLLRWRDSIAACDAHLVLSNRSATLGGGRIDVVRGVHGPLEIPSAGGRWGTAVCPSCVRHFQQCWRVVARDERALRSSWVVKVDPDSVFFASRLRQLVLPLEGMRRRADGENDRRGGGSETMGSGGLYLHNAIAPWGRNGSPMTVFWGPLHVLSRRAFLRLAAVPQLCVKRARDDRDNGGEDWWVDTCMQALKVPHVYLDGLLSNGVGDCTGHAEAALHPLKTARAAQHCRSMSHPFSRARGVPHGGAARAVR